MEYKPRLLILETSGRVGRVAVAHGDEMGEERRLEESRRHARDLAPAAVELCAKRGWKLRDLDAVIVSLGPGSYTGLRVGLISAKCLAYAVGCKLIGIETFRAIAEQVPEEARVVNVVADAQQKKLYVQRWRLAASNWRAESELAIVPAAQWLSELAPGSWVSGPGARLWETSLSESNPTAPEELRDPRPESLLTLGLERWNRAEFDDFLTIEPIYLRASNAEENWDRLGKNKPNDKERQGETGC